MANKYNVCGWGESTALKIVNSYDLWT